MKANVLIIEDENEIAELISLYLKKEGIRTTICNSGEEGLATLKEGNTDLLILDINLPGIDGYEVLQKLRGEQKVPVIIVSARTDDADMILGFGYGADDFVQKPFSPKVLAARVRAHLRRVKDYSQTAAEAVIRFGDYALDTEGFSLRKGKERINLSPKEIELLVYLATNEGKAISVEKLYTSIWGNQFGDFTTVSVHIQRLRKKIERDKSKPVFIKTVHGIGYLFRSGEDE